MGMTRNRTAFVLLLLLLATTGQGCAQQSGIKPKLLSCATIKNDIARLQCFDNLTASLGGGAANNSAGLPSADKVGEWQIRNETNPIDDSRKVTLILPADKGTNSSGSPVALVLRCSSNKTTAYIVWNDYLSADDLTVTSRIGSSPPDHRPWDVSTDNSSTFYPGNVPAFIKQLLTADRFVAQATPYEESPITAVFDLTGLSKAVVPLRKACNW